MSLWKVTGQAGWCEETGKAVYHVTKGSTSLSRGDHDELEAIFNRHKEAVELLGKAAKQLDAVVEFPDSCESMQEALFDAEGLAEKINSFLAPPTK